ncbi:hypothetical protein [Methylobacterium sp. GC_Met_2]|uniref:hypothetical protein n=1 Tax=Methylobacterium sp. GC_Met_2 TaxID=2937376 RepID=UPI00226B354F|nr:hypothetical protein [Methylobacterium sp. GC_Met_2]
MIEERRGRPRRDLFRLGELLPDGALTSIDCLVRNASEGGALIEVLETEGLPQTFWLKVETLRMNKRCQVARRTKHLLGVIFIA